MGDKVDIITRQDESSYYHLWLMNDSGNSRSSVLSPTESGDFGGRIIETERGVGRIGIILGQDPREPAISRESGGLIPGGSAPTKLQK